jgi:hypothetical protein
MELDTYVCEVESVMTNNELEVVLMKEYRLSYMKVFRLNDENQHCKI